MIVDVHTHFLRASIDLGPQVCADMARCGIDISAWGFSAEDHLRALEVGRRLLAEAPAAQALMIAGGLWFAVHAAPMLEAEFGKPVTLNITATTWAALHAAGDRLQRRPEPRWGKLLASL